jgi:hypothetical protein
VHEVAVGLEETWASEHTSPRELLETQVAVELEGAGVEHAKDEVHGVAPVDRGVEPVG